MAYVYDFDPGAYSLAVQMANPKKQQQAISQYQSTMREICCNVEKREREKQKRIQEAESKQAEIEPTWPNLYALVARKATKDEIQNYIINMSPKNDNENPAETIINKNNENNHDINNNDYNRDTPLNLALRNGTNDDIILLILDKYPQLAKMKDPLGLLPLGLACKCNASLQVIQALVDAHPQAVQEPTENDARPLHLACSQQSSADVVHLLINLYPQAVRMKDKDGNLPIHVACAKAADLEVIQHLLVEYEQGLQQKNNVDDLPIHLIVQKGRNLQAIKLIVSKHKNCLKIKDSQSQTPLIIALQYADYGIQSEPTLEAIQFMVDQYPESVSIPSHFLEYPLKYAMQNKNCPINVVEYLLDLYPRVLEIDFVHANICTMPPQVLQLIISKYPDRFRERDHEGKLPIHAYCDQKYNHDIKVEILQLLVDCYPESLTVSDHDGKIPLHYICHGRTGANGRKLKDYDKFLLARYPAGVSIKDKHGNTPESMLREYNPRLDKPDLFHYCVKKLNPEWIGSKRTANEIIQEKLSLAKSTSNPVVSRRAEEHARQLALLAEYAPDGYEI